MAGEEIAEAEQVGHDRRRCRSSGSSGGR
jgi:hypothetical protein